jgi:hypothetical protein
MNMKLQELTTKGYVVYTHSPYGSGLIDEPVRKGEVLLGGDEEHEFVAVHHGKQIAAVAPSGKIEIHDPEFFDAVIQIRHA